MSKLCKTTDPISQSFISPDSDIWRQHVLGWLSVAVPAKRIEHILRVEQMARELAECHNLDVRKAEKAGFLHDLAKFFSPQRLMQMAEIEELELDSILTSNPHLLHADIGAVVARDEFGVTDDEILQAIRCHTLGQPGMSPLSCVIYLADALEPGRGDTPALAQLRQLSCSSLYQAVWLTAEASIQHLFSSRKLIHPRVILTRNWAMQMATH
jgi:predicted HD superfamily hydrolase involved in NAD metabolism